jgi:hypothetical protein
MTGNVIDFVFNIDKKDINDRIDNLNNFND